MPPDAIAQVNGKVIRQAEYARAVEAIASDKRGEVTDSDRRLALSRLIEEELLIQHGIADGLVDSDRGVRESIIKVMLASIEAENASEQPSEEQLRAFYRDHHDRFSEISGAAGQRGIPATDSAARSFEEARPQVEELYRCRALDQALQKYLDWLRANAKITTAATLPR